MARPKNRVAPQSQTVDRAITILKLIAERGREMSVTEIARELDVYPSVVSRLVITLEHHMLLRQNPVTRRYFLGFGLVHLGTTVLKSIELTQVARPYLKRLNEHTNETIFMMVLDQYKGVYVDKVPSPQAVTIQSDVGNPETLHNSAVGKAILAFLPDYERDMIIERAGLPRLTSNTITDPRRLLEELAYIRACGFAIDDEEGEEGIRCIGAPILNHVNFPVASISIAAPKFRTPLKKLEGWKDALLDAARAISQELGQVGSR